MNTAAAIRSHIQSIPHGQPFASRELITFGSRSAVDQTLSRLAKAGVITRLGRGVFVCPKKNRFVGEVMPESVEIAKALAKSTGGQVKVHGAEAARRFGFSTQVPMRPIFQTSGPSRKLNIRSQTLELQHVAPRKLALAGRPAGDALSALWYLGKSQVGPETINQLKRKLTSEEFLALKSAVTSMPSWMSDAIYKAEQHNA